MFLSLMDFSLVDLLYQALAVGIPELVISMLFPHAVESSLNVKLSRFLHVLLTVLESLNFL